MATLTFKQFMMFLSPVERGVLANRSEAGVPEFRLLATSADAVDPSDTATIAALQTVLPPERLSALQAYVPPPAPDPTPGLVAAGFTADQAAAIIKAINT